MQDTYDNPERLYRQCYRYLQRTGGAQPFGFDWRTVFITHPQIARVMQGCLRQLGPKYFRDISDEVRKATAMAAKRRALFSPDRVGMAELAHCVRWLARPQH
jgi:hypothetical protein